MSHILHFYFAIGSISITYTYIDFANCSNSMQNLTNFGTFVARGESQSLSVKGTKYFNKEVIKERFIRLLKKRINYDSIIFGNIHKRKSRGKLIEELDDDESNNLITILKSIDNEYYDLPNFSFYDECFSDCLLSNLFISKFDNNFSNVASFFLFFKMIFEMFTPHIIRNYLGKNDAGMRVVDKVSEVLECTNMILVSNFSFVSTLHIIKEGKTIWELYCSDEDDTLMYSFLLIKRLLKNIKLPLIIDMDFMFKQSYIYGLTEFRVRVIEMYSNGCETERILNISTYIISHIATIIEFIYDDFKKGGSELRFFSNSKRI